MDLVAAGVKRALTALAADAAPAVTPTGLTGEALARVMRVYSEGWSGYPLEANKRLAPGAVNSPVEQPACSSDLKDPPRCGYRGYEREGMLVSLGVVA